MATQRQSGPIPYLPNFLMYSRPDQGWHDEPFEYCFTFQQDLSPASQPTLLNQPLQMDPDADFYMRGMAILAESVSTKFVTAVVFQMRLRNAFNRQLDNNFIPMAQYAASPNFTNAPSFALPWQATPWYPELYFPANSALWADFEGLNAGTYYSFHIYLEGVKRFKNETCKPQAQAQGTVSNG